MIRTPIKILAKPRGQHAKIVERKAILQRFVKAKKIDKQYKEPITESDGTLDYDYDSKEIHLTASSSVW